MELLISANKGEAPKPLAKIASGGELSRIMLALKCVIADKRISIPTLIFDEIDTGVSGKAAQKIGFKLKEVGKNRQVLCVTHLSQIAVMANHHLLIEKKVEGERTSTHVTPLDLEGRVQEIARIMAGDSPSHNSRTPAPVLLNLIQHCMGTRCCPSAPLFNQKGVAAICDKCVTQRTCLFFPTFFSLNPIFWAAFPLTPVSISSKIEVI